jgi:class 3 adenylate cyclase
MAPLNATLAAGDGTRLAVRIGMHTGPVVIADGGEVFGDTSTEGFATRDLQAAKALLEEIS